MNTPKLKMSYKRLLSGLLVTLLLTGCTGGGTTSSSPDSTVDEASTTTTSIATTQTTTTTTQSTSGGTTTAIGGPIATKVNKTTTTTKQTTTTKKKKPVDLSMFPVKETMSIEEAAAKVNNKLSTPMIKIKSVKSEVGGYDPNYTYNMHGGLAIFKGKLYVSHSRHPKDEDAPGQHVVIRSCLLNDFGNWSKTKVIGPATTHSDGVHQTSALNGWLYTDGEKLYAFYSLKEYPSSAWDDNDVYIKKEHDAVWTGMCTYTTDGVNWSEPFVMPSTSANEAPRQSLTGQWFAGSGESLLFSYDDTPSLVWSFTGVGSAKISDAIERGAYHLPESSWYQTDDYVIHHMFRSRSGYIWMANSYDNGKTWTDVYPTNFVSDDAMPNFGRLPDGRYYFVGTASGNHARFPLHLYVSKDGYNFDKGYILRDEQYVMQQPGHEKGGAYSYPEVRIDDTYMYILYAKEKEVMEVTRVKLTDI